MFHAILYIHNSNEPFQSKNLFSMSEITMKDI